MKNEVFKQLLDSGEFETMFKENRITELLYSGELSAKQLEQLVALGKKISKEELQSRQRDLARQPGYKEHVLTPLIKKILAEQKKVRDPNTGRYVKQQKEEEPQETPEEVQTPETENISNKAESIKKKFMPKSISNMFGKLMPKRLKNLNTGLYVNIVQSDNPKLRPGDGAATIATKIYAIMKHDIEEKKLRSELAKDFGDKAYDNEKRRHDELIDAIKKAKASGGKMPVRDPKTGRFKKQEDVAVPGKPTVESGKPTSAPSKPSTGKETTVSKKGPPEKETTVSKKGPPEKETTVSKGKEEVVPKKAPPEKEAVVPKKAAPKKETAVKEEAAPAQAPAPTTTPVRSPVTKAAKSAAKVAIGVGAVTSLGVVSAKEESAGTGVETVSGGMGGKDPGGVSYGKYQLESNKGTMQDFLKSSEGKPFASSFFGLKPGTPEFTAVYKEVAKNKKTEFEQAQQNYIERVKYSPVEKYAKSLGLDTNNRAVQEALFSQSVQHGLTGNKTIILNAVKIAGVNATIKEQVDALYKARSDYVRTLKLDEKVKTNILNRYNRENVSALLYDDQKSNGEEISKNSIENAEQKKMMRQNGALIINAPTTIVNQQSGTKQTLVRPTDPDKSPYATH